MFWRKFGGLVQRENHKETMDVASEGRNICELFRSFLVCGFNLMKNISQWEGLSHIYIYIWKIKMFQTTNQFLFGFEPMNPHKSTDVAGWYEIMMFIPQKII